MLIQVNALLVKIQPKKKLKKIQKKYLNTNLRNDLIKYLNNNPQLNFKDFQKYAEDEIIKLGLICI